MNDKRKVLVLLATYNGERFLKEQLDSIMQQDGVEVHVLIRDDGSKDNTVQLLKTMSHFYEGRVTVIEGENIGCTPCFMQLMKMAVDFKGFDADYYAFCDQDDVWLRDKLYRSTTALDKMDSTKPALFFGYCQWADTGMNLLPTPPPKPYRFTLGESFLINAAGGLTMVFNTSLLKNAIRADIPSAVLHDWWVYVLCLALSGNVYYDPQPLVHYRLHGNNVMGTGRVPLLKRINRILNPVNKDLSYYLAKVLYGTYGEVMSYDNAHLIRLVVEYKDSLYKRLRLMFAFKRFRTCSSKVNLNFFISVLMGHL